MAYWGGQNGNPKPVSYTHLDAGGLGVDLAEQVHVDGVVDGDEVVDLGDDPDVIGVDVYKRQASPSAGRTVCWTIW